MKNRVSHVVCSAALATGLAVFGFGIVRAGVSADAPVQNGQHLHFNAFAAAGAGTGSNAAEYLNVIRPGKVDGSGFWNANARWFMYSPAFAFKLVEGASKYRFRVLDDLHRVHVFEASAPTAPLTPVWLQLPTGYVTVTCEGLAADGTALGKAGERTFWKAAGFKEWAYGPRMRSYRDAATGVYRYVCNMKETDYLLAHGCPDPSYELNTYVSKMFAALINAMLDYSRLEPAVTDRAMKVARAAADHLIRKSEPAGAPLAYFPPTYDGRGERDNNYRAEQFKGQVMLVYPAQVATALASLYERTHERKYLEHAEHIAETYLRLQGEDGVWYLKMYAKDGKPVNPNRLVPIESVVPMFEKLFRMTGKESYRQSADNAFASVDRTRLVDWNWEGQFEDVEPTAKYVNLTKHGACSTAIYLGERFPNDPRRLAQMRELLRFSEDQFVCWEPPFKNGRFDRKTPVWSGSYVVWQTPCALEQYHCHWPIDASAAKMIRTYLALYRAEGNPVDLDKARALGDTATRMQCPDGRIPTWWWPERAKLVRADWINCMIAMAQALGQLAEYDNKRWCRQR